MTTWGRYAAIAKPCFAAAVLVVGSVRLLDASAQPENWGSPVLRHLGSLALGALWPGIAAKMWLVDHSLRGWLVTKAAYIANWAFWAAAFGSLQLRQLRDAQQRENILSIIDV